MDYSVDEYPRFKKQYKKARSKYEHSFDDDFDTAMQVIKKKIADGIYDQNPGKIPKTDVISGLGADVKHDVCKTRMYIADANGKIGRIIWLHDEHRELIYLIDIYHKKQRENHNRELIRMAYREYQEEYLS